MEYGVRIKVIEYYWILYRLNQMSKPCPVCNGSGKVTASFLAMIRVTFSVRNLKHIRNYDVREIPCPACNGTGEQK